MRGAAFALCLVVMAPACHAPRTVHAGGADSAVVITDDSGRQVRLSHPARRVISLIPAATEMIIALGAADRIVGRTRYDTASAVVGRPVIGGTLDPSIEQMVALHPDLVVVWSVTQRERMRQALDRAGIPTFSLRTQDTTDIFAGIAHLGRLLGRDSAAAALARAIREQLAAVQRSVAGLSRPSVFFVVYNDPPMTAGPKTFIGQLIDIAGGRTIFPDIVQNWPAVSLEEVVKRQPDLVVLPQGEMRADALARLRELPGWRDLRAVRDGHIVRVPADLINRPGPAIGEAARVLRDAFHPERAHSPDALHRTQAHSPGAGDVR